MKYYLDCEFIEGFHKPFFGKRRHFIDLISMGIVCEDGRTYYAISNEFDLKMVWNKWNKKFDTGQPHAFHTKEYWLRDNVLRPIHSELCKKQGGYAKTYHYNLFESFSMKSLKNLIHWHGKSNKQIAEEVEKFVLRPRKENDDHSVTLTINVQPEFYGYYADYDWVLLCSLFGRMMDLPKGFPMYCIDLKQSFDEDYPIQTRDRVKKQPDYPQQTNEHNALADAKWNKALHEFLIKL